MGGGSWTNGSGHEGSPGAEEVRFYPTSDEELVKIYLFIFLNKAEALSDFCFKDNTQGQGWGSKIPPSSTCTRVTHTYILSPWLALCFRWKAAVSFIFDSPTTANPAPHLQGVLGKFLCPHKLRLWSTQLVRTYAQQ